MQTSIEPRSIPMIDLKRMTALLMATLLWLATAIADGGGEGGSVNLPGGRNNNNNGFRGGQPRAVVTLPVTGKPILMRLDPSMRDAIACLTTSTGEFMSTLRTVDGTVTLDGTAITAMAASRAPGFAVHFATWTGLGLSVDALFSPDWDEITFYVY
jgi:hypothetical protein